VLTALHQSRSSNRLLGHLLATVTACGLLASFKTAADENCQPWTGDSRALEGRTISKVVINAVDIFDADKPAENLWIHRVANRLHYQTRVSTIADQLLFAEGDRLQIRALRETERQLRGLRYLSSADVYISAECDASVEITVRTSDVWSTVPEVSLSRVAGQSESKFSITESNLFGKGHRLSIEHDRQIDRVTNALKYGNDDWLGKRQSFAIELQRNEDGEHYRLSLASPYRGFNDTESWSMQLRTDRRDIKLYNNGTETGTAGLNSKFLDANRGWSAGLQDNTINRWSVGVRGESSDFSAIDQIDPAIALRNRHEIYPYLRLDHITENFIELEHIEKLTGPEDINLGQELSIQVGTGLRAWGADSDSIFLSLQHQRGFRWAGRSTLLTDSWLRTKITDAGALDRRLGVALHSHTELTPQSRLYSSFSAEAGSKLYAEDPLFIGGNSGLRGYAYKQQTGDRAVKWSNELRYYLNYSPLSLLNFGAAIFMDAGSAWESKQAKHGVNTIFFSYRFTP